MKNGKAADLYGITAEHLKLAPPIIIPLLRIIINRTLADQKIPTQYKTGVTAPMLKPSKPPKDPNGYRRITVNSMLGKLTEKEILLQTKEAQKGRHGKLQFGFQEGSFRKK